MVDQFKKENPQVNFVNAAVSGGAGTNAKAILASRLLASDPPDSYQRHAGLELQDDVRSGKVQNLTQLYQQQGWTDHLPQGLLSKLAINGQLYSVPVNIHRANLLWYSPNFLSGMGISTPAKTWPEFLTQAQRIKASGKIPLVLGPAWTQKHLFETVLLGQLGADAYEGLWDGRISWNSTPVISAIDLFRQILEYTNLKTSAAEWQPQIDQVLTGEAAYAVMGDWAYTYLALTKKINGHAPVWKRDFDAVASPGTDGVFDFLSDTFTLATGARNPQLATKWLVECGSVDGQNRFNPLKGSIPARTDADSTPYRDYLAWDLQQWRDPKTRIVGSLTHGVVANNAWTAEIDTALSLFTKDFDVNKFSATMARTYLETR